MKTTSILVGCAVLTLVTFSSVFADPTPTRQASNLGGGFVALSGFGNPIPNLSASDIQAFVAGQINFTEIEPLPKLGPLFNSRSCGGCHFQPALGGSGQFINEVRVRDNTAPGPLHIFASDNILRGGPQMQDVMSIFTAGLESTPLGCEITSPGCALSLCQQMEAAITTFTPSLPICDPTSAAFQAGENCTAERQATPLFGFGLIEAVPNQEFQQIAQNEPPSIRGVVKTVTELGATRVGRFGWKDDHATLRGFSADAYLNEMGISNPDNPADISACALAQVQFGITLDAADDPEDTIDSGGRADIDRFSDFMRGLAPPPIAPQTTSVSKGQNLFHAAGCDGCHTPTLTTANNPAAFIPKTTGGVAITSTVNSALASRSFHPFSDFLLHDMGSLGDGIASGAAGPAMMRTAPLWGVRAKSQLLHDGRAEDIPTAISLHDGQGANAASAFQSMTPAQQSDLLNYLNSI